MRYRSIHEPLVKTALAAYPATEIFGWNRLNADLFRVNDIKLPDGLIVSMTGKFDAPVKIDVEMIMDEGAECVVLPGEVRGMIANDQIDNIQVYIDWDEVDDPRIKLA
jgi:hypothetical protein